MASFRGLLMAAVILAANTEVRGDESPPPVATTLENVVAPAENAPDEPLAEKFRVPIVVCGFEPLDILEGVLMIVEQLEQGRHEVENQYSRVLARGGNRPAQELIAKVFTVSDRKWRGVGTIPSSGLRLRDDFCDVDAEQRFDVEAIDTAEPEVCIAGQILQGMKKPHDCPAFGKECSPQNPLGATMVSSEGACAAYHAYGRHLESRTARELPVLGASA